MNTLLLETQLVNCYFSECISLRIVYEREEPETDNPLPHLWRYRTIVSLEHFSQSFSTADLTTKEKCPLVSKLLREESRLFVTRYLPDIVQLQRRVGDRFRHRLDRTRASTTSIKQFLKQVKRGIISLRRLFIVDKNISTN